MRYSIIIIINFINSLFSICRWAPKRVKLYRGYENKPNDNNKKEECWYLLFLIVEFE